MGGQGQEHLNQKPSLEHVGCIQRRSSWGAPNGRGSPWKQQHLGVSAQSTQHLALVTHCDSQRSLCTENCRGHHPQSPVAAVPRATLPAPVPGPCQAGGRSLPGAGSCTGLCLGAEMLSQGRLKPDRKSALKTDPKIKKLIFPSIHFTTSFAKAL